MVPRRAFRWAAFAILMGCSERDRFTFASEDPGNGAGPRTMIDVPSAGDTVVVEGDLVIVSGRTVDPDGVDRVFFQVTGVGLSFAPLDGDGADTVHFGLPIPTLNHGGDTVTVQVYGVDRLGDEGPRSVRRLRIH
jgi:hypothetical protein